MFNDVTRRFDLSLKKKFSERPDVLSFLLKHERKNICINRLCEQIVRAENYSVLPNVQAYDMVIKDVAYMFANACLKKAEEDHYSHAKRSALLRQNDAIKEAEGLLKDLEKETLNDKGLTEIERDEIKRAIETRKTNEVSP